MAKGYAVLLHPETPQAIHALLGRYVVERQSNHYVFCDRVEPHGAFVELEALDDRNKTWVVSIPVSCVLAIADASDDKQTIGFLERE